MSDENGENEAAEQYEEEEDQDEVEEAPENTDAEGGRHCDLFGELNVPAGEEATAETEEATETKEEVQQEDESSEQKGTEESDKPAEDETTETKESTEDKEAEKPAEESEGDQQSQDAAAAAAAAAAQAGTKTNSDRQQDIFSRVFVGHLPTDRCTRTDVEKLFSQYGTITGCSVLNGYGFVQYKAPESVEEAIRHLHGHHFFGANIVVDKTDAARAALGEKPQKRPTPRRSGGYNRQSDYHQPPPRSHGYRDYGPPPYHPRGYGPPPHHYDHRESYYHGPPQRRGPPQHHYGYHRPRDDYYDGRHPYDYSEY